MNLIDRIIDHLIDQQFQDRVIKFSILKANKVSHIVKFYK